MKRNVMESSFILDNSGDLFSFFFLRRGSLLSVIIFESIERKEIRDYLVWFVDRDYLDLLFIRNIIFLFLFLIGSWIIDYWLFFLEEIGKVNFHLWLNFYYCDWIVSIGRLKIYRGKGLNKLRWFANWSSLFTSILRSKWYPDTQSASLPSI